MNKLIFIGVVIGIFNPVIGRTDSVDIRFSDDPASPAILKGNTPASVLRPGPSVLTNLGLRDNFSSGTYDNLGSLSYGVDPIVPALYFSVDRVSVGRKDTAVSSLAQP